MNFWRGRKQQKVVPAEELSFALTGDPQTHPKRVDDLHHRVKVWIAVLGQRLVQPLAGHANFARQLAHVAGAGDVADDLYDEYIEELRKGGLL